MAFDVRANVLRKGVGVSYSARVIEEPDSGSDPVWECSHDHEPRESATACGRDWVAQTITEAETTRAPIDLRVRADGFESPVRSDVGASQDKAAAQFDVRANTLRKGVGVSYSARVVEEPDLGADPVWECSHDHETRDAAIACGRDWIRQNLIEAYTLAHPTDRANGSHGEEQPAVSESSDVRATKYCSTCGAKFHPGDRFCASCGAARPEIAAAVTQPKSGRTGAADIQPERFPSGPSVGATTHRKSIRKRRLWITSIAAFAVALAAGGVWAGLATFAPDVLNPPPPEDQMLAQAEQSVVTINVIGDHFKGSGSGFFIDTSGRILTNYHVIANAWKVTVTTRGGADLVAQRVDSDAYLDIAELQVAVSGPKLDFRKEAPVIGERIYVLGNPGGVAPNSFTKGVVTKTGFSATAEGHDYSNLGMTDALVQPGNSGGPVVDRYGKVLGMVAIGSEVTGNGGFLVDSTINPELPNWSTEGATAFAPPPPAILVTESNFDGQCDVYSGCPMHATVTNAGGPGTATVTFTVWASNKTTVLATCAQHVSLNKGDTTVVRCAVNSQALVNYFYGWSYRQVWGNATITAESPIPL